ncbi:MAG: hypothetical protein ABIB97_01430 [Patescibacteria group bacterium]
MPKKKKEKVKKTTKKKKVEPRRAERLMRHDLANEEAKIQKMADMSRMLFWFGFGCLTLIVIVLIVLASLLIMGQGTSLFGL